MQIGVRTLAETVVSGRKYLNLVGERIRKHRKSRKLTQEQLAETIGDPFSAKILSRYENGETQMGINTYFEIAKALGVSPNDLAPQELVSHSTAIAAPKGYLDLDADSKHIVDTMVVMLLNKQKKQ